MRAAAVLACERRSTNCAADLDQVIYVQPIHPGQIEPAICVGDAAGAHVARKRIEPRSGALHDRPGAQNANLIPHQFQQFFAQAEEIARTHHEHYLVELHEHAEPGRPAPAYGEQFPLRVVAPAFLLSELTTGLVIGFYIYLPFLVVDLVVSAVLAATGLFMLPPALVATPVKLILFVLAGGWMLVATMLLTSFGPPGG